MGELLGLRLQLLGRQHPVDDAPRLELLGREEVAAERDRPCPPQTGPRGDAFDASRQRHDPKPSLEQPEVGPLGGPDQVEEQDELQTARHAQPVHRRERRERQRLDTPAEVQETLDQRAHVRCGATGEQLDVGTSAEKVALAADQEGPNVVGGFECGDDFDQIVDHLLADLVQGRIRQGQHRQPALLLEPRRGHAPTGSMRAGTCLCQGVPANSSRQLDEVSELGATPGTTVSPSSAV